MELEWLKKIFGTIIITFILASSYWYLFISLEEIPMEQSEIIKTYDYQTKQSIDMKMVEINPNQFSFTYKSYDGATVNGRISYPKNSAVKHPVLIGIHAMGRSSIRWWQDSYKGRPTLTHVNKITELADEKGYVVISIDARFHGKRKDSNIPLSSIMNDLYFFGEKKPYETMVTNTVKDYRVLLDWVTKQENLDKNKIKVVGYSMGGQMSLILASIDDRISSVISIVPPYLNNKTASVAPINLVSLLKNKSVLLLTSDDDENASNKENESLFSRINSSNKSRIDFVGNHILPVTYIDSLALRIHTQF